MACLRRAVADVLDRASTMSNVAAERAARGCARRRAGVLTFQVDPLWPKPLPNHWILGSVTGVAVDAQDHIWIVHRGAASLTARTEAGLGTDPPTAEYCCAPAPPVLEFDASRQPRQPLGRTGDRATTGRYRPAALPSTRKATSGSRRPGFRRRPRPAAVAGAARKARRRRRRRPGRPTRTSSSSRATASSCCRSASPARPRAATSTTTLNRPAGVDVDAAANEVYVADGLGNRRIVVFDATTGAYKRHWGAYGAEPDDATSAARTIRTAPPAKQFRTVSCVTIAKDGLVYVCDRAEQPHPGVQEGRHVREGRRRLEEHAGERRRSGTSRFSNDPQQQLPVRRRRHGPEGLHPPARHARRRSAASATAAASPGMFYGVGSVAVDSKGNVYTGETSKASACRSS